MRKYFLFFLLAACKPQAGTLFGSKGTAGQTASTQGTSTANILATITRPPPVASLADLKVSSLTVSCDRVQGPSAGICRTAVFMNSQAEGEANPDPAHIEDLRYLKLCSLPNASSAPQCTEALAAGGIYYDSAGGYPQSATVSLCVEGDRAPQGATVSHELAGLKIYCGPEVTAQPAQAYDPSQDHKGPELRALMQGLASAEAVFEMDLRTLYRQIKPIIDGCRTPANAQASSGNCANYKVTTLAKLFIGGEQLYVDLGRGAFGDAVQQAHLGQPSLGLVGSTEQGTSVPCVWGDACPQAPNSVGVIAAYNLATSVADTQESADGLALVNPNDPSPDGGVEASGGGDQAGAPVRRRREYQRPGLAERKAFAAQRGLDARRAVAVAPAPESSPAPEPASAPTTGPVGDVNEAIAKLMQGRGVPDGVRRGATEERDTSKAAKQARARAKLKAGAGRLNIGDLKQKADLQAEAQRNPVGEVIASESPSLQAADEAKLRQTLQGGLTFQWAADAPPEEKKRPMNGEPADLFQWDSSVSPEERALIMRGPISSEKFLPHATLHSEPEFEFTPLEHARLGLADAPSLDDILDQGWASATKSYQKVFELQKKIKDFCFQ